MVIVIMKWRYSLNIYRDIENKKIEVEKMQIIYQSGSGDYIPHIWVRFDMAQTSLIDGDVLLGFNY